MPTITAYTDSQWAGRQKSTRSTSGGIEAVADHVIKTYSRQSKVIALWSAEAERYFMVAASAEAVSIVAYARDFGAMAAKIYADSSAALGIDQRS